MLVLVLVLLVYVLTLLVYTHVAAVVCVNLRVMNKVSDL